MLFLTMPCAVYDVTFKSTHVGSVKDQSDIFDMIMEFLKSNIS